MRLIEKLHVTSKSPKGIFRPYGMTKWLDNWKMNAGYIILHLIHNDIYIDIQSDYYGKEDLMGTPYLKVYKWGMLAMEFMEDDRYFKIDTKLWDLYIRLPRKIYPFIGKFLERKYIEIN